MDGIDRAAVVSDDGAYRYRLTRQWRCSRTRDMFDGDAGQMLIVGLNPSTADDARDDPTVRRCMGFARREGCAELVLVNLFALRSPSPRVLVYADDPTGPENDRHIEAAARDAAAGGGLVAAAWGALPSIGRGFTERVEAVTNLLAAHVPVVRVFGWTRPTGGRDPQPLHPLFVPAGADLLEWPLG